MKQSRWTSKVMWVSAASIVVGTLVGVGIITPTESDKVNMVITAVLNLLGIFGVLNDPTNPEGF
jgi:uncharacterized membrane protein